MKKNNSYSKKHYEVDFFDNFSGVAFYDKSLDAFIKELARNDRKIKTITVVEDGKIIQILDDIEGDL